MSMMHPESSYRPRHSNDPHLRAKRRRKARISDRLGVLGFSTIMFITLAHSTVLTVLFAGAAMLVAAAYVTYEMIPKGTRRKVQGTEDPMAAPLVEPKVIDPVDPNYCLLTEGPEGPSAYGPVYVEPPAPKRNKNLLLGMLATYGVLTVLDKRSEGALERSQKMNDEIETQFFEGMNRPPWKNTGS